MHHWRSPTLSADERHPHYYVWRERLYRALYNTLIAGAVCYHAYQAPYIQASKKEEMEGFMANCAIMTPDTPNNLEDEDIQYLKQFPLYNVRIRDSSDVGRAKTKIYESLFGSFADWLIDTGAATAQREDLSPYTFPSWKDGHVEFDDADTTYKCTAQQIGSIREIKSMIGAYEHFRRKTTRTIGDVDFGTPLDEFHDQKTVQVILFGSFCIDILALPNNVEDAEGGLLYPVSTRSDQLVVQLTLPQIIRNEPNMQEIHYHTPGPEYEMFSFMLRRYFGLMFRPDTFHQDIRHEVLTSLLCSGDIFEASGGKTMLGDEYSDALVRYREMNYTRVKLWW